MTDTLTAAIGTAVELGLFPTETDAVRTFVGHTTEKKLPLSLFRSGAVDNINPQRFSQTPYPTSDRPRGQANLRSVAHHRRTVRAKGRVDAPIWVAKKNRKYIMLDGVHRTVATYLENKRTVPAFVVNIVK